MKEKTKQERGAECPNLACKKRWVWDWCEDSYQDPETGEFCDIEEEIYAKNLNTEDEVKVDLLRCECGCILSVNVIDPTCRMGPYNHPQWSNVDWDDPKYGK